MKSYIGGGFKATIYGESETKQMTDVSGFDAPKVVHRDGDVERIVLSRNVNPLDGSLTFKLFKNGSFTGQEKVCTSADPLYVVWTLASSVSVSTGDTLGIEVVSSSDLDLGLASEVDVHTSIEVIS